MPSIRIRRQHSKTLPQAKKAVTHVAEHLAEKFAIEWNWDGNVLVFQRSGVDGQIELRKGEVEVEVNLGFLLFALQGPIEREIEKYLDEEFGE